MEHLSPLDASFLDMEDQDPHVSLAIASLAVIDGPAPTHAEFVAAIRERLPLVPRYRQTVRRVPFDLAGPVWVDQPDIDLDFHLRRVALPAPGDELTLCRTVAQLMSQRLDRDHPLWEYWVVEGLPEGRWAVLSKVHHCMLDGLSGNKLYQLMFDTSPEPRDAVPDTWDPGAVPEDAALVGDAMGELAHVAANQVRLFTTALREPARASRYVADLVVGLTALASAMIPLRPTSLLGPLGQARRYAVARVPVAELVRIAKGFGVTVNDVVLAAVTGAFRAVLIERGEPAAANSVRTLVPVNVRRSHQTALDNRVSMLLPTLPVEVDDPVERLRVVHERVAELKGSHEIEAGASLTTVAPYEPFAVLDAGVRLGLRLPQRALTTVVTNVPGPPGPLFAFGRRIREILPWVPIASRMRIGVSVFTFEGQAVFGVTTDFASVPESDLFAAVIADEVAALGAAVPVPEPPPPDAEPAPPTDRTPTAATPTDAAPPAAARTRSPAVRPGAGRRPRRARPVKQSGEAPSRANPA
ncbi:wax ester/triacylglycerol synthase family O-acyltransferase [Virgisporangium ochraceum]|uniref:Diacylglycerol O-acyltransferase n=1 Tax=Virgisporangium ochraceum TaxID=65505 RepID=A0A8J3ZWM3_9ACTN|nr:wax ester/triacylglycerol synthase family O-acyltransferase [Virgisporangium ochraceum]GIJ71719.1 diacylglycerol O-acyltransferase [Virgisporangium ochraceum]